ncbi:hypothetical protein [Streptomyces sp. SID486]|nr:hypothetical protein [Streptomyces sp. SID486]
MTSQITDEARPSTRRAWHLREPDDYELLGLGCLSTPAAAVAGAV